MKKVLILVLLIFGALLIFNFFKKSNTQLKTDPGGATTSTQETAVVASNLEIPWSLVFLPNGDLLFTERVGKVKMVKKEDSKVLTVASIEEVKIGGEGGLMGLAVSPDFFENRFIYLYYTYDSQGPLNRVSRFKLDKDRLIDQKIMVDEIPGAIFHNGGRIKFGPDKFLYITTGDSLNPSLAQDKSSLAGKILKVDEEGKGASDNPYGNLVYSYGHRNPQGLAWDDDGRLWATEHGQSAQDEVNLIEKGKNYGWPTIRGEQQREGMVSSIIQSGADTWAPSGTVFLDGHLYFGGLRGEALYKFKGDDKSLKAYFKGEFGRIRDVVVGLDNKLYMATSNRDGRGEPDDSDDKIIKVDPKSL